MKTCSKCHETKPLSEFSLTADKRLVAQVPQSQCKACKLATTKAWYETNKARALAQQAKWRNENRAQWNVHMLKAGKKRHNAKIRNTPCWYDQAKVREIYELAAEFRAAGFKVEVDHIVPLQGETASGLHWHGNLRVCLSGYNKKKRNKMSKHHGPLATPVGQTI